MYVIVVALSYNMANFIDEDWKKEKKGEKLEDGPSLLWAKTKREKKRKEVKKGKMQPARKKRRSAGTSAPHCPDGCRPSWRAPRLVRTAPLPPAARGADARVARVESSESRAVLHVREKK